LAEIQKSATRYVCSFCRLVVKAVEKYRSPGGGSDDIPIHVGWIIDGHRVEPLQTHNVSRRLLLSWCENGVTKEAYFVYVPPQDPNLPNSDALAAIHTQDGFFARKNQPHKGKQALIRSWIDICDKEHRDKCQRDETYLEAFKDLVDQTYFGVIDVVDMQLKKLPMKDDFPREPEKFVALSYVWEKDGPVDGEPYKTTRSNVSVHLQHGGLESVLEQLPNVIKDTIRLIQRLGIRYLWVDRLCIVQDSKRSFRLNAATMNLIYGQAYLTICAADGENAKTGLKAMEGGESERQLAAEVSPGLQLLVTRSPENVIQDSKWNTRGWTFQERLLSPRCLIFAEEKIYFQCRRTAMSEDIHTDSNRSSWGLDSTNSPLQVFNQIERRSIWFYMLCVSLYTKRELTKAKDIIAAFDGMSNAVEKTMRAPFCFGLPTSHFDFALLWQPKGNLSRRIEFKKNEFEGDEFPSWSWTGWKGPFCQYDRKELEGCLLNIQDWILHHTWIRWYIRDENGNLRPLWDKDISKSDQSTEERWRGYTGVTSKLDANPIARPKQGIHDRGRVFGNADPFQSWDPEFGFDTNEHEDRGDYEYQPDIRQVREEVIITERRRPASPRRKLRRLKAEMEALKEREQRLEREIALRRGGAPIERAPRREGSGDDEPSVRTTKSQDSNDNGRQTRVIIRRPESVPPLTTWVRYGEDPVGGDVDSYGRAIRTTGPYKAFRSIISEYPFGNRTPLSKPELTTQLTDVPILQFFTWRKPLFVMRRESSSSKVEGSEGHGLERCDIGDSSGDWCGSAVLNSNIIESRSGKECQFIAISDAKAFTLEECPEWTYYVPKSREESEWDLYFVLLIMRDNEKLIWERVGLGKVFQAAFNGCSWDEIKLG
jgi:Heterokaryon incompatibility protein (HET)